MSHSHKYKRTVDHSHNHETTEKPTATRLTATGGDQPPTENQGWWRVDHTPPDRTPWFSSWGYNGFPIEETRLRGSRAGGLATARMRVVADGVARRPPMISNAIPTTRTYRTPRRAGESGGAIAR